MGYSDAYDEMRRDSFETGKLKDLRRNSLNGHLHKEFPAAAVAIFDIGDIPWLVVKLRGQDNRQKRFGASFSG